MRTDLLIIGGGASGLAAAIAAKRENEALAVTILEKNNRVGKKLLATGNGQCNLSNRFASPERYHGAQPEFVGAALAAYPVDETVSFFEQIGITVAEGENGKYYPRSFQAAAVLDCLRMEAERLQVQTVCDCEVTSIARENGSFSVLTSSGSFLAKTVILAVGGPASPALGGTDCAGKLLAPFGHRVTKLLPSIVQLKTKTDTTKGLSGLKFNGIAVLRADGKNIRREEGELLFTDYGISGPPILQLSGTASRLLEQKQQAELLLDLLPEYDFSALEALLWDRRETLADRTLENFFVGLLPKRIGQAACKAAGLTPLSRKAESLTRAECRTLVSVLKRWSLPVTGTNGMKNAQVTAGGLETKDFDPRTMMSKRVRGLFACGEALDIDGDCGGFNLQWAWSSGRLAGVSAAREIR